MLGDCVGGSDDLIGLFVQQEAIPKVRPGHVPVKILRFQVQPEHVRKQNIERTGKFLNCVRLEVRGRLERRGARMWFTRSC